MSTNELIALAVVVVRETRRDSNGPRANHALREYKAARRAYAGTGNRDLREADRAVRAAEKKIQHFPLV